ARASLLRHLGDRGGMRLRQRVLESSAFDDVNRNAVARKVRRGLSRTRPDQDSRDLSAVLLRQLLRGRERGQRRLLQVPTGLLRHDQDRRHQITFASPCSFCTRVWTSGTFTPPARCGGGSTFTTLTFGATSTPSCCGGISSIGCFFAFM